MSCSKSRIYFSGNMDTQLVDNICGMLDVPKSDNLGRYLGVPTLHGRVTRETYQSVSELVNKRLAGWKSKCLSLADRITLMQSWKSKCLSLAGRITLIQSMICPIIAFVMQIARLP